MADVHFYLPELTVDKKITAPSKAGLWKLDAKTVIRGISDAIEIGESAQGVSSIPDIWARPLMFQNFLFSVYKKRNPKIEKKEPLTDLEKRAFQEWKGLLSILALKNTKLSFEDIKIVAFSPTDPNDRFVRALNTLRPTPVALEKDKEYSWLDILIIRYNDVPVGAFSPSTLVYTAVDYNNDFKKRFASGAGKSSIVLDPGGYLCPPDKEKDILAVGEWVSNLKLKLDSLLNTQDKVRHNDRLLATMNSVLLGIWLDEIRTQLNYQENEPLQSGEVKVSSEIPYFNEGKQPAFLKNYNIYNTLLYPLETDSSYSELSKSDIELKFERNFLKHNGKEVKHVLIVTDRLYSEDLRIWDQLRYTALGNNVENIISTYFNKSADQVIKGKDISLINDGILWVRPEMFFLSDVLIASKNKIDLLTNSEESYNVQKKFILPFSKEILDFYSPQEINDVLMPAYDDRVDGVVTFSFRLPIIGRKDSLLIKKVYRRKSPEKGDGSIVEIETPILEIFPQYLGESWRRYFVFQGNMGSLKVTPIVYGENIEIIEKEYNPDYTDASDKARVTSIGGDHCFPEALQFSDLNGPSGLVLLKKPVRSSILQDEWTIGIDFGTSNTNVYKKVGEDGTSEHWSYDFEGYTRSITRHTGPLRQRLFNDYFVPTQKIDLPITTTIKMYSRDTDENKNILTDYFIYFPEDKKYEFPDFVLSNIKWDGDITNTRYFLNNLLFLILIEVVNKNAANVIFAYSWPKAFSEETMVYFRQTWERVYEELVVNKKRILNARAGGRFGTGISIDPPSLGVSEGIAAGEFFASKLNAIESSRLRLASVCLDVGGGTTDISVWWNNRIIEDFSLKFAGKEISGLLQKSSRLRNLLFSPEACKALEAKEENLTKFSAVLNHVLKVEEHEINARMINLGKEEIVKRFRQMIAIQFGALAYYAGMVCYSVGSRNSKNGRSLLSEIASGGMTIYWGGNAAKLLNWVDLGKYREDGLAAFLLNALFYNCLSDKSLGDKSVALNSSKLNQVQSPRHKSEASGGLVAIDWKSVNTEAGKSNNGFELDEMEVETDLSGNSLEADATANSRVVCGENIEVNGESIPYYALISDSTFFEDNETLVNTDSVKSLERLTKFITILNAIGIRKGFFSEDSKIALSEQEKQAIVNNISAEFLKNQSIKSSKRTTEPIFIMEVRFLMDILRNKWIK